MRSRSLLNNEKIDAVKQEQVTVFQKTTEEQKSHIDITEELLK